MKYLVGLLASCVCMLSAQNLHAGFAFQAADSSDLSTLGASAFGDGTQPVELKLFLVNIAPDVGVFNSSGATFRLSQTSNVGIGTFAAAPTANGSGFDFGGVTPVNPTTLQFSNALFFAPAPTSTIVNGMQAIEVGTFSVSGVTGNVQTFDFVTAGGSNDVNVTPGGNITGTVYGNSSAFTVSVPEPTSLCLIGGFGAIFALRRRRVA